jgi:hypothetical protein
MLIAAAVISVLTLQSAEDAAGRYQAVGEVGACFVTLRPAAAQLPDSHVTGEAASGFAFAAPGCPGALSQAGLWRLSLTDGVLTLIDGAGETLFTGRREDQGWSGETASGEAVTLQRR